MLCIAHATKDYQGLAAGRRPRHAVVALRLARLGVPVLLAWLAWLAVAGVGLLALAGLAGALAMMTGGASLARMAWILLRPHCMRLARRAAAGRARARACALARGLHYMFCIFRRQLKLIQAAVIVIIGNRLLPSACISPRIKSQRPN